MKVDPCSSNIITPRTVLKTKSDDEVFVTLSEDGFSAGEAIVATAAGAVGFGLLGALGGVAVAEAKIHALPVQSVTETWREPTTQDQIIGKIPADHYSYSSASAHNPDLTPTEPVHAQVPVLDKSGVPVYHQVTKVFSDHGTPIVDTHHNVVSIPSLVGSTFHVSEDTHTEQQLTGFDSDNNPTYTSHEVTDGYWTRHSPDIKQVPVQSSDSNYDTKSVRFHTGVDVGRMAWHGFLYGVGVGAVVGLASDVAHQILQNRHS